MAQPSTDQHQRGVSVWEGSPHPDAATDLPVEPLDHIVSSNTRPVLRREFKVSQRLLNTGLDFPGRILQFHLP